MKYIRMSDLIYRLPISNNDDRDNRDNGKRASIEMHIEDTYITMIGDKNKESTKLKVKTLIIPKDTKIYNKSSKKTLTTKDLIMNIQRCSPGSTKLQVVDPICWPNVLDEDNCLIQLNDPSWFPESQSKVTQLAFQCEWPDASEEWLNRTRRFNWPKQEVIDEIKVCGCRVVPKCVPTRVYPSSEWKFTFDKAEEILEENAVSEDQLCCLLIVKIALNSVMNNLFTIQQLKHVLFFLCEETEEGKWKTELAECIWIFLDRLKECLTCKQMPNYFMPCLNLLEKAEDEDDTFILRCIECIDIIQNHPFVTLYFICDDSKLVSFDMKQVFNTLVEDSRQYAFKQDIDTSVRHCFLPIVAEGVSIIVRLNRYMEALDKCQKATNHLNMLLKEGKKLQVEDVISHVICLSYRDIDKWMFAFAADQTLGTLFTETVCSGRETVSFFDFFGPLQTTLRTESSDIPIPQDLVSNHNLPETICYGLEILERICPREVYSEVMKFLLSNHFPKMVENGGKFPLTMRYVRMILDKIKVNLPKKME